MKIYKYICALIIGLTAALCHAQQDDISFKAVPSQSEVGLNERLRIDFVMNKDGDNFSPPDFEGFRVVAGPSQSISRSWINGKSSFSKTYSYFLSPKSKGNFTIKQALVDIDGQTYKTSPIQIKVTDAVESEDPSLKTPGDVASGSIRLVAEVSKDSPYLNEAISVIYKLYYSDDINLYNIINEKVPEYKNFLNQTLPEEKIVPKREFFDGKYYNLIVVKKVVLFPQKSGQLIIDSASMELTLQVPTGRFDFFGQQLQEQVQKTVSSLPKIIQVKPLPLENRPENFDGAVGEFAFSSHLSRNALATSESLQATLEISGTGNMPLIKLPSLQMPSSIEVYKPEIKENFKPTLSGSKGSVSETYTLVPQYKGSFKLPKMAFSYFDPKKNAYQTIYSGELPFDVTQGPEISTSQAGAPENSAVASKHKVKSATDLQFIKTKTRLFPIDRKPFIGSWLYFLLLLIPLIKIPSIILFYRRKKGHQADADTFRAKQADKLARKYLSEAKKQIGQKEMFYIALDKALHNFLKSKLKIETSELSKDKIRILLSENAVTTVDVRELLRLMENCEMARYTPLGKAANEEDYKDAVQILSLIDKQL